MSAWTSDPDFLTDADAALKTWLETESGLSSDVNALHTYLNTTTTPSAAR